MPALKMKNKSRTDCVGGHNLHTCHKPVKISKSLQSQVKTLQQAALLDIPAETPHGDSLGVTLSQNIQRTEASDDFAHASAQLINSPSASSDSATTGTKASQLSISQPISEALFSPVIEYNESQLKPVNHETLVHSTLEHCDDADFTFPVFFNMKQHTVYVRRRPYLQTFLEKVAQMFEIVIFTASQSIYAEQLLNILDPDRKLISRRIYRESCIFSDGSYTKDLTILGIDLAKVAIIDNSPQVFQLQVNNGIPIKSWFDDPSDHALISLLPFLETLVDAEDVRPIIAKRFGNKE